MAKFLRSTLRNILHTFIPPQLTKNSYSQAGEDAVLAFLFSGIKKAPTYLDLGANNPDWGNNTFMFYIWGSRGVLVEADTTLIPQLKKIRPEDKILNVGVSVGNLKAADFFIFSERALNTFNKQEADFREKMGTAKVQEIVKVELMSVNDIIAENFDSYPDLMSIDIEGLDLDVLESLDYKRFPVPVICAETCRFSENHIKEKDRRIENLMLSKGYFVYADTYINTIFVNMKWFSSI